MKNWLTKTNKQRLLGLVSVVSIAGLGYVASNHIFQNTITVEAQKEAKSKVERANANNAERMTQANIIMELSRDLGIELNSNNKLTSEDLDVYAYIFVKYMENGVYYSVPDGQIETDPGVLLKMLKDLYERNGLDAPYVATENGKIELKKTLEEPGNMKSVWNNILNKIKTSQQKEEGKIDVSVDVDVRQGDIYVVEQ